MNKFYLLEILSVRYFFKTWLAGYHADRKISHTKQFPENGSSK